MRDISETFVENFEGREIRKLSDLPTVFPGLPQICLSSQKEAENEFSELERWPCGYHTFTDTMSCGGHSGNAS